ncbi:response regulator [Olivibacter domesticus]|uniref:Two component transcriptional regulator, LuxR family n=1 Tax=Olivibacter domesticus TaxID=407022 RepID=A0A1H7IS33_OLID1|nr:response regulator transcription factor [Olivibacter domesticus]SEK63585.1 two component transcriptional regulator, LuxR family [Olivibacter domesticus]
MELIRIAVVDDHQIVIQGLKSLLVNHEEIEIVGSFTSGLTFMIFLKDHFVDVVLLDIMLPDANGMELCKEIKLISPNTRVLALSNHTERSIILQMLQNGANGYLLKNISVEELVKSIYEALSGGLAFSKEVKEIIAKPSQNELRGVPQLTKREKQILQLIAEGKTTIVMADQLYLSPLTVETHRRNLLQKFEAKNVAELIRVAAEQKLL